uniref:Transposase zinc-ribbon domain-containing protein n=1 Tax=Fervidobacterium pennivorans TaxID=93466 RepID=A0A7V4KBI6_FERPE
MPTTVKLNDNEAQLLKEVRNRIIKYGTAPLENLTPVCPRCGTILSGFKINAEYWRCDKCGYSQGGINIGAGGKVALGAIMGAGLVALLWWLSSQSGDKR